MDAKSKIGFIDGSLLKPQLVDHPLYTIWCKCNNIVLAWLFNSISKDLQPSVVYFKTAKEVWLDLQHRFSQDNGPHIFELRKEICSLAQENLSISSYYTKFKSLLQELSDYRTCSCGHQAEDCVISFLMGLNETYNTFRGQILLMDPIPSLGKCFLFCLKMRSKGRLERRTPLSLLLWQSRLMVLLNPSTRPNLGDLNVLIVEFWDMYLINAASYLGTLLVISSRPRVHKLVPLLIMLQ